MSTRQKQKNKKHCELTERDFKLFRYLWKWKLLSTMALTKKFFPNSKGVSAYRRLRFLEVDGYLKSFRVDDHRSEAWSIAEKAFKAILPKLGALEHVGFKSENVHHDYLAAAFHLGEWLTKQPEDTQNFSEQQLRRYPQDAWPDWVPRSPNHRPDGYSVYKVDGEKTVTAFEVELSVKTRDRYGSVVAFYDGQPTIKLVLWLIDREPTIKGILKSFEKFQVRRPDIHQFVLLSNFLNKGWMAPVSEGRFKNKSIKDLLEIPGVSYSSDNCQFPDSLVLLDTRKYPIESRPSKNPKKPKTLTD